MPTAAWIGSSSVERKVTEAARVEGQPELQIRRRFLGLMLCNPTRMRRAPRAGVATRPMRVGKPKRKSAREAPAQIAAQRLRAPDMTLRAVSLKEPPTGKPPSAPEAMLAAPWARKSREPRRTEPSGLG